ncbi:PIN domain-containing protein [Candidatus Albibeggiatoa sp. nov. BB20]|uniref:PIN domain-containing protein n=1 Tax=Candidatus Albibeggiatoa sp. nov. BB20 TaxID=3162723 RepID=UPI003365726C
MKIYMDACCFNRPFDEQSNLRVKIEAEAIKTILTICEEGSWQLISSQALEFEIGNTTDEIKKMQMLFMLDNAVSIIQLVPSIIDRAKYFETKGITAFDAMHLACAETQADIFLTVDDKFLRKAQKLSSLAVNNPLNWLSEVL